VFGTSFTVLWYQRVCGTPTAIPLSLETAAERTVSYTGFMAYFKIRPLVLVVYKNDTPVAPTRSHPAFAALSFAVCSGVGVRYTLNSTTRTRLRSPGPGRPPPCSCSYGYRLWYRVILAGSRCAPYSVPSSLWWLSHSLEERHMGAGLYPEGARTTHQKRSPIARLLPTRVYYGTRLTYTCAFGLQHRKHKMKKVKKPNSQLSRCTSLQVSIMSFYVVHTGPVTV